MDSRDPGTWLAENKSLNLPLGFKFIPTSEELIEYYLIPKLKGEKLPSPHCFMNLDDLYQYEPYCLPFNHSRYAEQNKAYFFTLNTRKNQQILTTPKGYWKVYTDSVPVREDDELIGFMTKFFYHTADGNQTQWKMVEYRCHPSRVPATSTDMKSYVVCKIMLRMKDLK